MTKIFYDHLVIVEEVTQGLDEELVQIIDETFHHRILNVILTHLPSEKHEKFLEDFHKAPHDPKLLEFLLEQSPDIEEKIRAEAKTVKAEILKEIKLAKRSRHNN